MSRVARWPVIALGLLAAVSCFAGELTSVELAYLQNIYSQMNANAARLPLPGPGSAYIRFEITRDARIINIRAENATSLAHAVAGTKLLAGVRAGRNLVNRPIYLGQTANFH
ncbi:MAG: hypothetical protein AB7U61_14900 [Methylocystis sp.]